MSPAPAHCGTADLPEPTREKRLLLDRRELDSIVTLVCSREYQQIIGLEHVDQSGMAVRCRRKGRIGPFEILAECREVDLAVGRGTRQQ